MSARVTAKKKSKSRSIIPVPGTAGCVFLALLFGFLSACLITQRISPRGAAGFYSAFCVHVFFLMLFPLGAAQALRSLVGRRYAGGFFRNAARLGVAAAVNGAVFVAIVALFWLPFAERIADRFLMGPGNEMALYWMFPLFAGDTALLLLCAYIDGTEDKATTSKAFLLRQFTGFVFLFLFSGMSNSTGEQAAKLLHYDGIRYIYGAGSAVILLIPGTLAAIVYCVLKLRAGRLRREEMLGRDANKKHESPSGLLYGRCFPLCFSMLGFFSIIFVALLIDSAAAEEEWLLRSYQWGMFGGVACVFGFLPLALIFLLQYAAAEQVTMGAERRNLTEVRLKCQSLNTQGGLMLSFFAVFTAVMAPQLAKGVMGVDSAMAVRLMRLGSIVLMVCGFALMSGMQILMLKRERRAILHCFLALPPAGLVYYLLRPSFSIYAMIPATGLFFALILAQNLRQLWRMIRYQVHPAESVLLPLGICLAGGVGILLLGLLFGLFLPALVVLLICGILYFLFCFIAACRFRLITAYGLRSLPFGEYLIRLGLRLKQIKEN